MLFLAERFRWFAFNEHKGYTVLIAVANISAALAALLLWFAPALVFRCRFQFGIRMLLVLVVAVALPCSWLAVEMKEASIQKDVSERIRHETWVLITTGKSTQ